MAPIDRRLLRSSRAARTHVALAVALGALGAVLVIAQASLLAHVIDRAFLHGAGLADVRGSLAALAAVAIARALVAGGFEASGRLGAVRVMSELRARLARHLLVERPERRGARTGELAAAAVQGVDALEAWFSGYLPQLVLATIVPLTILGWLAPIDLGATAILAVTLPLIPLFMILIGLRARARTDARWRALSLLSGHFLDVVRGLPTLRAHRRERAQARTIAAVGDRYRRETMGALRIAFLSALVLELLAMLGTAMVAAAVGVQLAGGHLQLEAGLTVLLLAPELYLPLRQVGAQFHASADGMAAAGHLFDVLGEPAAVAAPAAPVPAPDPGRAPLRLEAVRFRYPEREGEVLRGIDLELAPGEVTALVGPSGAGKSTLAALLLRLADPTSGRVSCGGVDLGSVTPEHWRRRVAWVPQRARLFAGTVADNIRLGEPEAPLERVRDAARRAGVLEEIAALPDGFATRVGDGGRGLSAGQAQRIAVARAFLRDAPLVVLDEPTAHLDAEAAATVGAALERLERGRTTLLIVHRPALAARADRIVTLRGGMVAGDERGARRAAPATTSAVALRSPGPAATAPGLPAPAEPADARLASLGPLVRAARLAGGQRRLLAGSIALAAGAIVAAVALLAISGYLISRAAQRPEILTLTVAIVSVRALSIARAGLRYGERIASHDLAFRVLAQLRVRFFEALAPLVPGDLAGLRRGDLLSRFVGDVDALQHLYLRALAPPVVAAVTVVAAAAAGALMLPAAALALGVALLAGAIVVPVASSAAARAAGRRQAAARARLTTELVEAIEGAAELSLAGREHDRVARVCAADARLAGLARRDTAAAALATSLGALLSAGTATAVLAVGVAGVRAGAMPGVLLAGLTFLALASFEGLAPLPAAARHLRECAQAAVRLEAVTSTEPAVRDPSAPRPLPAGALAVEGVRARYAPAGPWVLDGVGLTVAPGRRVALVGSSGAGKTTLGELLVRFRDPEEGRVTIGDLDVRDASQDDVRRAVVLAAQDAHLFTTTIRENVLLARREASDEEVLDALARAGLAAWTSSLPEGLDTLVGEDGELVSGGQRQRIALARALLADSRFLVLDEPAAHLDAEAARTFLRDVAAAAGDRGLLVITHTFDGLEDYDEICVLDRGRIVERGRPDALLAADGRFAALAAAA